MNADAMFARCAQRRRAVADLIESLGDAQLGTDSLCAGWDVRTVAGHLKVPLVCSPTRLVVAVARHGGSFGRANTQIGERRRRAVQWRREPIRRAIAKLGREIGDRFTGMGADLLLAVLGRDGFHERIAGAGRDLLDQRRRP